MLTGYKINNNEIVIDDNYEKISSTFFKPVAGNSALSIYERGQIRVLPDTKYYKVNQSNRTPFASYLTSTIGGHPTLTLEESGTFYFKFIKENNKIKINYSKSYSGKNLVNATTVKSYDYYNEIAPQGIKMWFAICGGGGGGQKGSSQLKGGGGAAAGFFTYTFTVFDDNYMFYVNIGSGGLGQIVGSGARDATDGGKSSFGIGYYDQKWEFSDLMIFNGGKVNGDGGTYSGSAQSLNGDYYTIEGSFVAKNGTDGVISGTADGFEAVVPYADYVRMYNTDVLLCIGGHSVDNRSGGGGCSWFSGSSGNAGYPRLDGHNGGGGGSNFYAQGLSYGGNGGNGACHIWFPDGDGETDNYPSGKDVTNEVAVSFEVVDSTHKKIIFTSSSIPQDTRVKLEYKFKTVKIDTTTERLPYSVEYEGILPHTDTYSSTLNELTGDISSSKATVI